MVIGCPTETTTCVVAKPLVFITVVLKYDNNTLDLSHEPDQRWAQLKIVAGSLLYDLDVITLYQPAFIVLIKIYYTKIKVNNCLQTQINVHVTFCAKIFHSLEMLYIFLLKPFIARMNN